MCFIIVDMSGFCTPTLDHFDYNTLRRRSYGIPGIYSPEQEFPKSRNQKAIGSLGPRGIALPKDGAMTDARCVCVVMRDLPVSRDLLLLHITRRFRLKTTKRGRRRMND